KLSPLRFAPVAVALACAVGCSNSDTHAPPPNAKPQEGQSTAGGKDAEHEHKPGAHGGILVPIGRGSYHAEAVFETGGALRLYTLGNDEAKVQEVETQTFTGYVKPEGGTESTPFVLQAVPQPGDAQGKTSQFVGQLPQEQGGRRLEITIPSIRI